jgi:hypothetical protein
VVLRGSQALVFAQMKSGVCIVERGVPAGLLAGDEIGNIGQARLFVQFHEVEQRLHALRTFFVEEIPLRLRKPK